jgi:hypothetical protein
VAACGGTEEGGEGGAAQKGVLRQCPEGQPMRGCMRLCRDGRAEIPSGGHERAARRASCALGIGEASRSVANRWAKHCGTGLALAGWIRFAGSAH